MITPPSFTFATTPTMTFGGTAVEMRYLGRGHTDNDIAISLPERNVLFAGDLIEEGAPPSFNDSFPLDWPETVAALLPLAGGGGSRHGDRRQRDLSRDNSTNSRSLRLARERFTDGMTPEVAGEMSGPYSSQVLASAFVRAWRQLEAS